MSIISLNEEFSFKTHPQVFFNMDSEKLKFQLLSESAKCIGARVFLYITTGEAVNRDIFYETSKEYPKLFLVSKMIEFLKRKNRLLNLINTNKLYESYLCYDNNCLDEWKKQYPGTKKKSFCQLRIVR